MPVLKPTAPQPQEEVREVGRTPPKAKLERIVPPPYHVHTYDSGDWEIHSGTFGGPDYVVIASRGAWEGQKEMMAETAKLLVLAPELWTKLEQAERFLSPVADAFRQASDEELASAEGVTEA